MQQALSIDTHARLMIHAERLAEAVEREPTPTNIRKWRQKAKAILRLLETERF